ncbi:MAG: sensor histidine kinase [Nitrososphaera sp.]
MQKEFINIAAHELRTPIQAILGYAEVLVNSKMPSSPKDLEAIARNAKRLQRLTEDILDVTRIESGKLELKKEKFLIDDVIAPVVQDAKSQLGRKKSKARVRAPWHCTACRQGQDRPDSFKPGN